ncbi:transglycosylase domain-containing protein [Pelagibacterium halotolerans]|uniref:Multimodular transpeptidase-transglycosylase n=1 Tax=Pelagibacterium halotolerans (strain DSM 22347 / JCM 15775 / CGMCC 1.7692 / B2) TaxID=1082931 RepID=G4R8J7_PELHB|nr:transglycosylase domain-containing protein [Pelagibacterium halotolerans]AEQ53400.1 multimodular transpeptidase-transglycosylase [Pelagibacterium halotolerans B2]QJR16993.1 penicillin-binding protein [Pelagibacterium halotolerans]SEA61230.1 penicillin-binding protein 1A [Pelagibacterium halotolerans]
MDLRLSPDDRVDAGAQRKPKNARGQSATRSGDGPQGGKPRRPKGQKVKKKRSGGMKFIVGFAYFCFTMLLLGGVAVAGIIVYYGQDLGSSSTWEVPQRPPNIRVLASNGQLLTNRGQTGGEAVGIHELPPYVGQAVVASEDRRFYSHFGVDPIGLTSVALEMIRAGGITRGASTITQQVAKNLFLTPDQTLGRKVQEALLAVWLEQNYSKDQILELYLNRVHFGSGSTGIEAAAQTYFGISARNLSLGQAAMLAGILPAPSYYNPRTHPDRAAERQRLALANMVRAGYITQQEADAAAENMDANITTQRVAGTEYYVADWVETLMNDYLGEVNEDVVVSTTLDWDMQKQAEFVIKEAVAAQGEDLNFSQAAFVAMDTEGRVRALVGGVDYSQSSYNRAVTSRRQPGSAFKPFVYLAALQQGYTPDTLMVDEPLDYEGWQPENSNGRYVGPVLLRDALAFSINTVSARLAIDIGPENVVETAYRMGFSTNFQPVPSIALGTQEVSLLELTSAYAPFANGGYGVVPNVITRITTTDGEVLFEETPAGPGRILTDEQVGMMNDMLQTGVQAGTGTRAQLGNWPMAGKTGTTQRNRDALFVGYTASLVGGVWLGNDDDTPTRVFGGQIPAQIWRDIMTEAHEGLQSAALPGNYVKLQDRVAVPMQDTMPATGTPVTFDQIQGQPGQQPTPLPQQQIQPQQQQPVAVPADDGIGGLLNGLFGG